MDKWKNMEQIIKDVNTAVKMRKIVKKHVHNSANRFHSRLWTEKDR